MRMLMGVNNFCFFMISLFIILSATFNGVLISAQCLNDQRSLLLQLKGSLNFTTKVSKTDEFDLEFKPEVSTKLVKWSIDEDCCNWNGVACDISGRVISLELDRESISGGIENSTSLFKLQYLQKLNLAYNNFNFVQIPSGIANLKNLVHLNLSSAGFGGEIPIELSYLRKLVSLDLSTQTQLFKKSNNLELGKPNLKTFFQDLVNLEELYLDYVDMSTHRSSWSQALASSLPRLRILSLIECGIEGPIDASLSELRSLSVIQLDGNNLSTTEPDFFANFSNLTTLTLRLCELVGKFPAKIFQVLTLQNLDLSFNYDLHGSLEQSLSNLHNLYRIDLSYCNFNGSIPPAMTNLSNLVYLDLSANRFTGSIPIFHSSKNLSYLNLQSNFLTGNIPPSIFALPSLIDLFLSNNKLSGKIDEFSNASSSLLETLTLYYNHLNGSIPESIFKLRKLKRLDLSSNSFSDTLQLESIVNLVNLSYLDLSHNKISVDPHISNPSMLPQLTYLKLASCELKMFPELANQSHLKSLDLSDNQIEGEVPNWISYLGGGMLRYLNLSANFLVSFQKPHNVLNLYSLDLHANQFQGEIPITSAEYVDYSSNNFSNSLPSGIGNNLSSVISLSLANNSLTGSIPASLCNATNLRIIDFSNNLFTGKIPSCLLENLHRVGVLNLARNNLTGKIPDNFPVNSSFETLDFRSNALEGKIPKSLINCTKLEVLNIGNNKLEDTFPCTLKNSYSLRVLVLRSNKLYGDVICHGANNLWAELQIIDIASNNFTGVLTPEYFSGWTRMMLDTTQLQGDLRFGNMTGGISYNYLDNVRVTIKGQEMELVKIMKVFTIIDFSNNMFRGAIPDNIGDLRSLYLLNLSYNAFTGRIPSSIGKLKSLGSLDISRNQLTGEIPASLANLNFLAFLNLSFNNLSGRIPTGSQLQTFTSASYERNTGLCGWPLNTTCIGDTRPSSRSTNTASKSKTEIKWEYVLAATGYSVGLASFISVLLLCKSWREKYFYYVDKILLKIVKQKGGRSIAEHQFRNQATRRL